MRYYPIFLDLKNKSVAVIGGGVIAEGKAQQLIDAGASIYLVSPEITPTIQQWVETNLIAFRRGEFTPDDLCGAMLVICATNSRAVNESVAEAAAARSIWCNVVDQTDLCNFITPSLLMRGDLQIAISSGGKSPTVAQRVKREISELIGAEYETFLDVVAALRTEAKRFIPDFNARRDFMKSYVESEALTLIRAGKISAAEELAQQMLSDYVNSSGDNQS